MWFQLPAQKPKNQEQIHNLLTLIGGTSQPQQGSLVGPNLGLISEIISEDDLSLASASKTDHNQSGDRADSDASSVDEITND